jgi:transcriptional regulator with XRE-family HTH domain/plasmid maintenance system antidote protein VapI
MSDKHQLPEGKLIEDRQKRDGISARKAAKATGLSDTRWRNIVNGYQAIGNGQTVPVVARAETLARMARTMGITAQELADAGREDAGEVMKNLWPGDYNDRTWGALQGPHPTSGDEPTRTGHPYTERGIRALIERKRAGRSLASLADACGDDPTARRLQQITAHGIDYFPKPRTINGLAKGLGVSVTDVTLACAASLGLEVDEMTSSALVLAGGATLPHPMQETLSRLCEQMVALNLRAGNKTDPQADSE